MKNPLLFEFVADKVNNTLTIKREFAANRKLVWDCYTKSELLDQWFAPKPFTTKTKTMSFHEGGHWHYAMIDTSGTEYWGLTEYLKIQPIDYYRALDAFCDADAQINTALPRATWDVSFREMNENAMVQTVVTYASLDDLEAILEMGMQEGLASTLERLDELLLSLTSGSK